MSELLRLVQNAFERWNQSEVRAVRLVVPAGATNPFLWLAAQSAERQALWSCRNTEDVRAGLGACSILNEASAGSIFEQADRMLGIFADDEVRYFGGFAFRASPPTDASWSSLGASQFWIPLIERGVDWIACNLLLDPDSPPSFDVIRAFIEQLQPAPEGIALSGITGRQDSPDQKGWAQNVELALQAVDRGDLQKVVLARKADYQFARPETAASILAVLRGVTGQCYHFLLQAEAGSAFMGTPPECLFRREGTDLQTEALAGTRPRSDDAIQDDHLSHELMESRKERSEHEIVREAIVRRLAAHCSEIQSAPQPALLKLERKQHLITPVSAQVRDNVSNAELLESLHPTPAVGGSPREPALDLIEQLEPFSRGWYAGPVGWISRTTCEFAVAIRSGLVCGKTVSVYSGAGIVEGSVAEQEWAEIENKISDFVKVTQGRSP